MSAERSKLRASAFVGALIFALLFSAAEATAQQHPLKHSPYEAALLAKLNASTIGLAAGRIEGAPLRFATELARVMDDGERMRVLPIVTRGPFENVYDLLYVRGMDAAIIYGDVLEHFKKDPRINRIEQRIHYISHLFPSEVHVFARPEINSLEELAGKPVNFNTHGTAAAYSGPIIFDRLGIKVQAHFTPHSVAMAEMAKTDKYAAVVFVSSRPLDPFVKRKWPAGFKFLPVPLTEKLEEYYVPAQLEASDYPGLIAEGHKHPDHRSPGCPCRLRLAPGKRSIQSSHPSHRLFVRAFAAASNGSRIPSQMERDKSRGKCRRAGNVFAPSKKDWSRSPQPSCDSSADGGAALKKSIAHIIPGDAAEQNRLLHKFMPRAAGKGKRQTSP